MHRAFIFAVALTLLLAASGRPAEAQGGGPAVRTFETDHFRIVGGTAALGERAEARLSALRDALAPEGFRPSRLRRMTLTVHADEPALRAATGCAAGAGLAFPADDEAATHLARAAVDLDRAVAGLLVRRWLPGAPAWIRAGLTDGGYAAAEADVYARAAEAVEAGGFVPIEELLAGEIADDGRLLQARLVVEHLVRVRGRLIDLYDVARGKRSLAEAFAADDLPRLDAEVRAWVAHRAVEAPIQAKQRAREVPRPRFEAKVRLESEHFVLFSTGGEKLAGELLAHAERVRDVFGRTFWDAGIVVPGRLSIYVFDRRAHYADFVRAFGVKVGKRDYITPHFNPMFGAACVQREGVSRDYLFQNTAHEVAHGLAQTLMRSGRRGGWWTVEGIAHYVGMSVHARTEAIDLGAIHETKMSRHASYLRLAVRDGALIDLGAFCDAKMGGMSTTTHHAQAFGLFHFLRHGEGGRYREGLHRYLRAVCRDGDGSRTVFAREIGRVGEVERELRRYLRRLEADSKRR